MEEKLPVYRRDDVELGNSFYLPHGSRAINLASGDDLSLEPGIYAHPLDGRTDDELREQLMAVSGANDGTRTRVC